MFFYLYCGRGFSCLYGGWMKRCFISWSLCDNPENSFGQHKSLWNVGLSRRWEWLLFVLRLLWWVIFLLSESIKTSRISFLDSTQACFANETSPLCIFNKTSAQLTRQTIKSLLNYFKLLQATL